MPSDDLSEYVLHGGEERYLEYKPSLNWQDAETKAKITKSVLAMANIRDGGVIVLGVEDNGAKLTGMTPADLASFDHDKVSSYVNGYADPFVQLTVSRTHIDGKDYVVIQIQEFAELPVICKKQKLGNYPLRQGAIYTRTTRLPESSEVPSQTEMREILDLAIDKGLARFRGRLRLLLGPSSEEIVASDQQLFDEQLGDL